MLRLFSVESLVQLWNLHLSENLTALKKSPVSILLDLGLDIMMGDDLGFLPGI